MQRPVTYLLLVAALALNALGAPLAPPVPDEPTPKPWPVRDIATAEPNA
jgi:hypothetical protein